MNEIWSWTFPLFRFRGVPIRCHWSLPLMGIFDVMLLLRSGLPFYLAPLLIALLFASVLLHEGGHMLATIRSGGRCHRIVLWALGGWAETDIPMRPWPHLLVAVMGPVVNVGIWALATLALDQFPGMDRTILLPCLTYLAYINAVLALFNAIPCHPLDGGHATTALLWGMVGIRRALRWTIPIGYVAAAGLAIWAFVGMQIFLVIFAVWLGLTTYQGHLALKHGFDRVFGIDQAYAHSQTTWFTRWSRRRAEARAQQRAQAEASEAALLDELLDKVSKEGLPSLTPKERKTLERISQRQRERGP